MNSLRISLLLLLVSVGLSAQQGISPLGMRSALPLDLWSPAQELDTAWVVTLPSFYISGFHTGPSIWDGLERDSRGNPFIDLNKWVDHLDEENTLITEIELVTLGLQRRIGNHQWGIHHAVRTNATVDYPREAAEVLTRGNAPYIGQTLDIGPHVDMLTYHQIAVSYAYHGDTWSLGARIKRLQGIQQIQSQRDQLSLYTDPEYYQLTFDVDYRIRQAGILEIAEDLKSITLNPVGLWDGFSFKYNGGWGADIGATWRPAKDWTLQAALLDIGHIRWNHNSKVYEAKGEYTFDGLDIRDIIDLDTLNLDAELDTLKEKLNFEETEQNFTGQLPLRLTASVAWDLNPEHRFSLNGVYRWNPYRDDDMAIALQWNARWNRWFATGLQYAVQNQQADHIGINLMFDLKYVQFYAWTDNLVHLGRTSNIHVNAGFGMQLTFR